MSVPVAAWLGERLANPHRHKYYLGSKDRKMSQPSTADSTGPNDFRYDSHHNPKHLHFQADPCKSGAQQQPSCLQVSKCKTCQMQMAFCGPCWVVLLHETKIQVFACPGKERQNTYPWVDANEDLLMPEEELYDFATQQLAGMSTQFNGMHAKLSN